MGTVKHSVCRVCSTGCPILVEIESNRVVRVTSDRSNRVFEGYTCVKGRAQPEFLNHPNRLRTSLKRAADGTFKPISSDLAMDEIAARLQDVLSQFGPRAIAHYFGFGGIPNSTTTILWP